MMQDYEKLKQDISIENIYESMDFLVNQVGERLSGTVQMRKASEYICNRLEKYGVDSWIDHFPMYQSYPKDAALKVILPEEKQIKARPVCHIESTTKEGIEGELIYLNSGTYEDYEGKDVSNKIVLVNMNWSPGRPEKARIAWEMGAKALIIMNWGLPEDNLIQMGAVKAQWGNPTPETEKEIVRLTVISISRADGEYLADLCHSGKVQVWLQAEASREWITADQAMGRVRGGKSNGQYILVGSHVDAWGKSAICNASGNAVNMELARILEKHKAELTRDIVFAFWDGHEIAEGGGSTWYCDQYWPEMNKNCIAYINIDNLAIKGTSIPGVESQPELKSFLLESIQKIWETEGVWHHAYKGGGDSSFFGIGVPYISFATEYTEEELKELNYAFYSPWLHSNSDTIDKLDQKLMEKHIDFFLYILLNLIKMPVIPYNLQELGEEIRLQWSLIYQNAGQGRKLIEDIDEAVKNYNSALVSLLQVDLKNKHMLEVYNHLVLLCERETAIFRCKSGRYGQDSCCSLQTEKPIPALEEALRKYNQAKVGSHEFYLWETQILRVKNMVFDALSRSIDYIQLGLMALSQLEREVKNED